MSPSLPGPWRRAAVYGSLWAAVEIVAGSFLHNLRVPMAGSVLAAFGVLVMTAAHRRTREHGLIWRAALVCALMKSISPSAVILGPMVGIAMEGILLESMVRVTGATAAGYLVGGALAVSWAMVQRVLNALLSFGPDFVRLYVDAYGYAARSLGVRSFGPFDLVATLVALEMCLGLVAAAAGLRLARHPGESHLPPVDAGVGDLGPRFELAPTTAEGHWSLARLALVSVLLVGGMVGIGYLPLPMAALFVLAFAAFVLRYYPRAARRIRRLSLWVELAIVMLAAGLVLGGIRHGLPGLLEGLAAGAAMTLRASMVLFGFTAVSVELRNPTILAWVERRKMRGLSDALGMAFSTLPTFMSAAGEIRRSWRTPLPVLARLLHLAEAVASHHEAHAAAGRMVILTGETRSGKTTLVGQVVERLRATNVRVAGIMAPGFLNDGHRTGFDIVDVATGERAPLAREQPNVDGPHVRWSRFAFDPAGLALGQRALATDAREAEVVVIDEVGPMELSGGGWAPALDALTSSPRAALLLVVRASVVEAVVGRWGLQEALVSDVRETTVEKVVAALRGR